MLKHPAIEKSIWGWRWPVIFLVVIAILIGIQFLRVNRPRSLPAAAPVVYSTPGALLPEELVIDGLGFHSTPINLNRRMKISGTFRTKDLNTRVNVLVFGASQFESWKLGLSSEPIVQTGLVPGGRITPTLEPGAYYIVIDNGDNSAAEVIQTAFRLD